MTVTIHQGDALAVLKGLPDESVQCVVTSPPYLGLRSYGTTPQVWGGDPEHAHTWGTVPSSGSRTSDTKPGPLQHPGNTGRERLTSDLCACGAWRGELGREPTPALFIDHLVMIFEEVKRVMRPDAVLWVNLGDSYWTRSAMRQGGNREQIKAMAGEIEMPSRKEHAAQGRTRYSSGHPTLKDKDLMLIPERFAIAMQDSGWYVRSRIAWAKLSSMPESVRDRPTSAWEHVWMFTRSARYYWDQEAVRVPSVTGDPRRPHGRGQATVPGERRDGAGGARGEAGTHNPAAANLRNFWLLGPEPSRLAHYAGFPTRLPALCIKAATSERGCCPACGAGWIRQTESSLVKSPKHGAGSVVRGRGEPSSVNGWAGEAYPRLNRSVTTTGWQPGCACDAGEPVPQTVLDPFLGSGTTALVADRLGRHAIGIELSARYCAMARRRIASEAGIFDDTAVVSPEPLPTADTQPDIFTEVG